MRDIERPIVFPTIALDLLRLHFVTNHHRFLTATWNSRPREVYVIALDGFFVECVVFNIFDVKEIIDIVDASR